MGSFFWVKIEDYPFTEVQTAHPVHRWHFRHRIFATLEWDIMEEGLKKRILSKSNEKKKWVLLTTRSLGSSGKALWWVQVKLDQILGLNRSARLNGDIEIWTSWHFDNEMKNAEGKLEKEKEENILKRKICMRRRKRRKIFGEEKYFFSRRVFCRDKRFLRT